MIVYLGFFELDCDLPLLVPRHWQCDIVLWNLESPGSCLYNSRLDLLWVGAQSASLMMRRPVLVKMLTHTATNQRMYHCCRLDRAWRDSYKDVDIIHKKFDKHATHIRESFRPPPLLFTNVIPTSIGHSQVYRRRWWHFRHVHPSLRYTQ